jgi:hypothetical protein
MSNINNSNYSDNFVGFVNNDNIGNDFVSAVRSLLRGTGLVIRPFGRNKNRKQFYKNVKTSRFSKHKYACNLPLKHATHYGLYIYKSKNFNGDYASKLDFAKKAINNIFA